ncbi:MAG: hypothetical protein AB7O28_14240 [Vicinamibacterales bacterium]
MAKVSKRASIQLDDFVEVATDSALRVIIDQQKVAGSKFNPKIWVGIWIDPYGPNGPLGPQGPNQ